MIPFDFDYYRPDSIDEAVKTFEKLESQGKQPIFYSGGTEIISFARKNDLYTNAVIDIKGIPECNIYEFQDGKLIAGAAITLTHTSEINLFPLLSKTSSGVADHTIRNKVTLGGNICGRIIYREAVLPFLLCDSIVVIAGRNGVRFVSINQVFDKKLQFERGEFLVQLITEKSYIGLPYISIKKTKLEEIDYPLVTISALKDDRGIRIAFSGAVPFPFRSLIVEDDLNNRSVPIKLRVENALNHMPAPIMEGISGSAGYRRFVMENTIYDILTELEGN